jgi:hypothetical protein
MSKSFLTLNSLSLASILLTMVALAAIPTKTLADGAVAQNGTKPPEKAIDLGKVDKCGVSEDIRKELQELKTIDKQEKAAGLKEPGEKSKAKMRSLSRRIPLSAKTRELQFRMGLLQQKLAASKSDAEAQKIIQQMRDLQKEMMVDPNYVKAERSLRMLGAPKGAYKCSTL